jgi:hypothetical protein
MNRHVRLFEEFEPQTTPHRELWARFIGYDEEILGVHPTEEEAELAQYDFIKALEASDDERPHSPSEIDAATDTIRVDFDNKNMRAELVYYCKNSSVSDLDGAQQPEDILRTLIEHGVNPFEESGNYEVFSDREELEDFFNGDLSWYPGGEKGIMKHLDVLKRNKKTRNLFGV